MPAMPNAVFGFAVRVEQHREGVLVVLQELFHGLSFFVGDSQHHQAFFEPKRWYSFFHVGHLSAARRQRHQVAQKFSSTTLPRKASRLYVLPSRLLSVKPLYCTGDRGAQARRWRRRAMGRRPAASGAAHSE